MNKERTEKEWIEIQWTTSSLDEARKVARLLVQERYVFSAQIIPWIESIYYLGETLDTTQESKVIIKTEKKHYASIQEIILKNTHYEVPEILWFTIGGMYLPYEEWAETVMH